MGAAVCRGRQPGGLAGSGRGGKSGLSRRSASGDPAGAEAEDLEAVAAAAAAADGDDDGLLADVAAMTGGASGQDAIAKLEVQRPIQSRFGATKLSWPTRSHLSREQGRTDSTSRQAGGPRSQSC